MFLLRFKHDGKKYFLHSGEQFIGAETKLEAHLESVNHTGKAIGVGGFDVVEVDVKTLLDMIGGVPYSVIRFSGGLGIPFCAVEIVNE
jgi:hypothetical protein